MSSAVDTVSAKSGTTSRRLLTLLYWVAAAAVVALAIGVPSNGYVLNILMQAATYSIAVFGLTVVLGLCGQINLAQAAFFGFGAYAVGLGTTDYRLNFWLCLAAGMVLAVALGAALGAFTLRLVGHYLAMVTISFQQIVTVVLINWIPVTHGPDGVSGIQRPAPFLEAHTYLGMCIAILAIVGYLVWRLPGTQIGRAMRAVRDNELAAGVAGIDVYRVKVVAFAISALLGGLGGGLFAGGFAYVSPDQFSFAESVVFLTMVLLGGVASPIGAVIGTSLLILIPEWLRFLKSVPGLYLAIYGAAVILIMVFMPEGIWGFVGERWRRVRRTGRRAVAEPAALSLTGGEAGSPTVLEVAGLAKHFGGLKAVDAIDLTVRRGGVHALIGPNGSGKTTTLNVLSGLYRATAGSVRLNGRDITGLPPHRRTAAGLGRTFQNIRLWRSMSALENVTIGAERPGHALGRDHAAIVRQAQAALAFVGLAARADEAVASFSYGHQRAIEIARALAADPVLLLLDEPGAGLNSSEKVELRDLLRRISARGLTILIIDHDMTLVSEVAEHITVLNFGRRIADGESLSVLAQPDVIAAYLGSAPDALLELVDLVVTYGEIEAVRGVSLQVEAGEVVTLLGSNGAGKSTTLRAISGLEKPRSGEIRLDGQPIAGLRPEEIVSRGIAHVPEGRRVFPGLSVRENIMLGASNRGRMSTRQIGREADEMFDLFPDIRRFSGSLGWTLSGGQQQMVAVARGLMAKPRLLLLDEPSLGLAPVIVQAVFAIIAEIRRRGTTVLLVEQNARMGLSVADRGYVLETGRLVLQGTPGELWANEDIRAAYLGGRTAALA